MGTLGLRSRIQAMVVESWPSRYTTAALRLTVECFCARFGLTGKRKAWAAAGLGMLALTLSSAGVDLIMSLQPDWYSSGFGLILICSAMKLGLAAAIVAGADFATPEQRRDLGNLLLMYVMLWGYVAFVQFQIIWAENLPREISWYVPRLQTAWKWTGVLLIVGGFFTPLLLLLSRRFKENGRCLRNLAGGLCFMAYVETAWLVMPSVPDAGPILLAAAPLALGGILLLAAGKLRHDAR